MFRYILTSLLCCALLACGKPHPGQPSLNTLVAPRYIVVIILYRDGDYVGAISSDSSYVDRKACLDEANSTINKALEGGHIPVGGTAIGACVPIPTIQKPVAAPVEPKPASEPKATAEQGTI